MDETDSRLGWLLLVARFDVHILCGYIGNSGSCVPTTMYVSHDEYERSVAFVGLPLAAQRQT